MKSGHFLVSWLNYALLFKGSPPPLPETTYKGDVQIRPSNGENIQQNNLIQEK
jgi:hypothetical protein